MHCSLKVNISIHLINRQNSLQMLNAWVVQCRQEWKKLHRIVISFLKENEICKCQIFKWGSWLFLWLKICACDGNEISMFTVTWEFLMCVYSRGSVEESKVRDCARAWRLMCIDIVCMCTDAHRNYFHAYWRVTAKKCLFLPPLLNP